jgi:hypothetical protein
MENTGAVPPAHPLPRTPKAEYPGLQRCRTPSVPLTCLARPAAWQSLCTGHVENPIRSGRHRPPSGRQAAFVRHSTRQVGGLSLESHHRRSEPSLDQGYTGRLWTLPTVDYVDGDSLALDQTRDPRALQRRSVHKDILAAPI